jgi:hypothetical protein
LALLVVERTLGEGACRQGKKQQYDPDATRHLRFPPVQKFAVTLRPYGHKGKLRCLVVSVKMLHE